MTIPIAENDASSLIDARKYLSWTSGNK